MNQRLLGFLLHAPSSQCFPKHEERGERRQGVIRRANTVAAVRPQRERSETRVWVFHRSEA